MKEMFVELVSEPAKNYSKYAFIRNVLFSLSIRITHKDKSFGSAFVECKLSTVS